MSGFKDFLMGTPDRIEQVSTVTPEQKGIMDQILGGLGGGGGALGSGMEYLQQLLSGDPKALEAFQAPAMRQFQEQTIPGIAERFSGIGGQRSSAFGQQLGSAGAGLAESLSAQKSGLQSGALSQLMSMLGIGMQSQFENQAVQGTEGFASKALSGLGSIAGGVGGAALTGGLSGAIAPGIRGFSGGLRSLLGGQ